MRWHFSLFLHWAAVTAAVVSLLGSGAPTARGHGGGGHWGGGHWGGGHWGGHWGPGFYRPYYGYGLGAGAFGLGLGLGYGLGYGMGGYYAPYYGGYAPYYGGAYGPAVYPPAVYPPAVYPPVVAAPNAAAPNPGATNAPAGNRPPPDNAAHLQLIVPEGAEVWFAGSRIAREGRVREFVSPPLAPGQAYTYKVVVRYTDAAGKPIEDKRDIQVRANDWFSLDFTRPAPSGRPNLAPPPP